MIGADHLLPEHLAHELVSQHQVHIYSDTEIPVLGHELLEEQLFHIDGKKYRHLKIFQFPRRRRRTENLCIPDLLLLTMVLAGSIAAALTLRLRIVLLRRISLRRLSKSVLRLSGKNRTGYWRPVHRYIWGIACPLLRLTVDHSIVLVSVHSEFSF